MNASFTAPQLQVRMRGFYFDRAIVIRRLGQQRAAFLAQAGAYVQKTAARSMRYSYPVDTRRIGRTGNVTVTKRQTVSKPGRPPMAVITHPYIRKRMAFAADLFRGTVVVGPESFGRKPNVPQILEHGGRVQVRNQRRALRRVGGVGEITIGRASGRSTKPAQNEQGQMVNVTYARLKTGAQAMRANRLNMELYGASIKRTVTIAARPYMAPALAKAQPKLETMWTQSITRMPAAQAG